MIIFSKPKQVVETLLVTGAELVFPVRKLTSENVLLEMIPIWN